MILVIISITCVEITTNRLKTEKSPFFLWPSSFDMKMSKDNTKFWKLIFCCCRWMGVWDHANCPQHSESKKKQQSFLVLRANCNLQVSTYYMMLRDNYSNCKYDSHWFKMWKIDPEMGIFGFEWQHTHTHKNKSNVTETVSDHARRKCETAYYFGYLKLRWRRRRSKHIPFSSTPSVYLIRVELLSHLTGLRVCFYSRSTLFSLCLLLLLCKYIAIT